MKYSIISENHIGNPLFNAQTSSIRIFSNFISTAYLEITNNHCLKLKTIVNSGNQYLENQMKLTNDEIQIGINEEVQWNKVVSIWNGEDEWILITQNPVRVYILIKKYKKIVPVLLQEKLELQQVSTWITYPDMLLYGHHKENFINKMYTINLQTFQAKEVTAPKNYSPGARTNYWSYFSDARLYVTGGRNKKQQKVQQLIWTFNMESGYWFSLEMNLNTCELSSSSIKCEYESGKVLVLENMRLFLVELYQSKIKEVQGWSQLLSEQQKETIRSVYTLDGFLYFSTQTKPLPYRFKIAKQKEIK